MSDTKTSLETAALRLNGGPLSLLTPTVATLPDGSRVNLPAGTVLCEASVEREYTAEENFAALKHMAPSLAGVHERAAAKHGIAPWDVTEEQAWEECPALRPAATEGRSVVISRPRSALAAAIDAACGITPDQYAPTDPVAAFLAKHADDPDTFICTCGQERKIGAKCSTPERCAILFARASCVCSIPGATRRECGGARNLKTPCRCYCHTRLPEEKATKKTPALPSATVQQC